MAVPTRYLTKSLFKKALECPRKLAYALSSDYTEKTMDAFLQSLVDDGKLIGAYSRLLFPNGIEIIGEGPVDELVQQTNNLLEANDSIITIFEAAVRTENCLIRADILQKTACGDLELMEVKAKSWDAAKGLDQIVTKSGDIKSAFLPYIQDVAFQKLVLQECFPGRNVTAYLVLPDKTKINNTIPGLNSLFQRDENGNFWLYDASRQLILDSNEILVSKIHVDDLVDKVIDGQVSAPGIHGDFRQVVCDLADILRQEDGIESLSPPIGSQCRNCEFRTRQENSGYDACWSRAAGISNASQENLVVDLHYGGKIVDSFISNNQYFMADLEPSDLGLDKSGKDPKKKGLGFSRSEKQWYQAQNVDSVILDRDYLCQEMASWEYPWHFIDFETISSALPYTTNKRPWEILAFQFSHHILDRDGSVTHASEFLHAAPGQCPNRPFLVALAEALRQYNGTIFRWGAHENTVLSNLVKSEALSGPDLDMIESLIVGGERAMVDLMRIAQKGIYVPGSNGSSSIKKLLLPTMKISGYLKDLYSLPYNGKNFTGMQWWQQDCESGYPLDPYSVLSSNTTGAKVADGGDAVVAYKALQSINLDNGERAAIEKSLLKYCELDTLAMAMIAQGLQGFVADAG